MIIRLTVSVVILWLTTQNSDKKYTLYNGSEGTAGQASTAAIPLKKGRFTHALPRPRAAAAVSAAFAASYSLMYTFDCSHTRQGVREDVTYLHTREVSRTNRPSMYFLFSSVAPESE